MSKKPMKAVAALQEAQKIAFAPFVFQTTVSLRNLGVFDYIFDAKRPVSQAEICEALSLSEYGLSILLEIAESAEIVEIDAQGNYELTKIGYFLNYNRMTEVNINFTQDVCYKGLHSLEDTIRTGKPKGLKEFGDWDTIYKGLAHLPSHVQRSWFAFDHFYSDSIFEDTLTILFKNSPRTLFDIGGNTGKFAMLCCNYDPDVHVKIFDLPGQLQKALANAKEQGLENRISGEEIDWLSPSPQLPEGADLIWMSQFLDCFAKEEILKILKATAAAMDKTTELIIVETYTDRQRFGNAKFTLEATSLYFAAMANGNSKMYASSELMALCGQAGLTVTEDLAIGEFHTMFVCKKAQKE
ncbi:MAG: methyltransferase [Bacteroidota bacterium]